MNDLDAVIDLANEVVRLSSTHYPPPIPAALEAYLAQVIDDPAMFARVAEDRNKVIGYITAKRDYFYFNPQISFAAHDSLFVTETARGSLAAKKLVQSLVEWAAMAGCWHVFCGVGTGYQPERTNRFFERLGFNYAGNNFVREL